MTKRNIRIGFIGAGSIGSLFGGYLANIQSDNYSLEVIFFNTRPFIEVINEEGLKLFKDQEVIVIKNIIAYESENHLEELINQDSSFQFDFLFLTTKAYDSEKAMLQYKEFFNASKYLVILQNGIGDYRWGFIG